MIDTLLVAELACKAAREANAVLTGAQIETVVSQYRSLVQIGQAQNTPVPKTAGKRGRPKQSSTYSLLRRLFEREREVLRFVHDLRAPFTNNLAERAVRMPKVRQRISGCFRTLVGAENFCVIRSYFDTARKQGFGMLHVLQATFSGQSLVLV